MQDTNHDNAEDQVTPWDSAERLFRVEMNVTDCEVEGEIPSDLEGCFHRIGPDPQYRLHPNTIPFDGDGHASVFRIKNGRVNFRSRFVRTDRYLAQEKAGRILFPIYRNPYEDDPSVLGMSRSTANTHIVPYKNMMLALKEDSPPSALDPFTLETIDANYNFDGQLKGQTFTAHPKFDSHTGNLVGFGYEADGHGSDAVQIYEFSRSGQLVWNVKINVPYVSLLHDFAVTENFIAFFLQPVMFDEEQMRNGGVHWAWDSSQPTYVGCIRRGGDGSDLKWVKGPTRGMYHIMGAFDDKERVYIDAPVSMGNQLPFMPQKGGEWNLNDSKTILTRTSMDMSGPSPKSFEMETLAQVGGELPRQDDRYNTVPYRYGFQASSAPDAENTWQFTQYLRIDHQTGKINRFQADPGVALYECVFAPKSARAGEGEGYIIGVGVNMAKGGETDLLILDAERLEDGPIAKVKLPCQIPAQIHSWWTPEYKLLASE
ncbi:carotenoid oxygenase family protein [Marinomonas sp. THO17]|uniref:carotenoid oxygenase family protein n=1 Tax=Marinomonas sp. THO17 TaxID=3149048 RepID=UPI00336BFF95